MGNVSHILEKHEVPKEFHDAFWEAYRLGVERGFNRGVTSSGRGETTSPKGLLAAQDEASDQTPPTNKKGR